MAKQILLYNEIYSYTASAFLTQLDAYKGSNVDIRVNCPGGDPYSTYGMIAMVANSKARMLVDGRADSCAAYMVAASGAKQNTECLTVSSFTFHRASTWMEKYPDMFTDAIKAELAGINTNLRAILEDSCGGAQWLDVTGVSLDTMFSMEGVKDVKITAEQAKQLGFVVAINPLTAVKKTEIIALSKQYNIAAFDASANTNIQNENNTVMEPKIFATLAELKTAYPGLVAEAETAGNKAGITAERKRINGWLKFMPVDAPTVIKAIADGADLDMDVIADMTVKMQAPDYLARMKKGNVQVTTAAGDNNANKTEAELAADAFQANADKLWAEQNPDLLKKKKEPATAAA